MKNKKNFDIVLFNEYINNGDMLGLKYIGKFIPKRLCWFYDIVLELNFINNDYECGKIIDFNQQIYINSKVRLFKELGINYNKDNDSWEVE